MDKETLSNYGWIVICVLVLAVMIALASPFGTYVSDAVKSTTQGLFDVQQGALSVAGIDIADQSFEDASGGNAVAPESIGWANLIAASKDGTYTTKYPVGTLVTLGLKDGTTATFRVVAHNTDNLADDSSNKANLTLISETALFECEMNATDTAAGGWGETFLRNYLSNSYLNSVIPNTVLSDVKDVSKKSVIRENGSYTSQTTTDKLWIPSYTEIGIKNGGLNPYDGTAYEYYTDETRTTIPDTWLRSISGDKSFQCWIDGKSQAFTSSACVPVIVGFCI